MKIHQLKRTQRLNISLHDAWDFLSDPANLKTITPDYMGFDILSGADRRMYAGQIITYTVRPLLGIPMTWVTEISQVEAPYYFVDEQRFGPYALWHHKHFLREVDGGVEMDDIVDYALPLDPLSRVMHPLMVAPKLEEIFDHRVAVLDAMFNQTTNQPNDTQLQQAV